MFDFSLKAHCCQSCGMPLWKDLDYGGTNKDGTKSKKYCSHCYANGAFTDPDLTLDQMIIKVKDRLRVMFIPKFLARYFTMGISKLDRWRTAGDNQNTSQEKPS
ncbi:MAG: zinc ribbon domain-containing protein [Patescibacteria group bacterium]